jgi:hypothetical protein
MREEKKGNEHPQQPLTRRGLFGAVAGAIAVVATVARRRKKDGANPRRRGFWIGHT